MKMKPCVLHLWIAVGATCIGALAYAGPALQVGRSLNPADSTPKAGEITHQAAISRCARFCRSVGLAVPADRPQVTRWREADGRNLWSLEFRHYKFGIDTHSGAVRRFQNEKRTYEQVRRTLPPATPRIRTGAAAALVAQRIAKAAGLRKGCKLVPIDMSAPAATDANTARMFKAEFRYYHKGHTFHLGYGGAKMRIDPQDGVLCWFSQSLTQIEVEADTKKLTFDEAAAIARPIVVRHKLGVDRTGMGQAKRKSPSVLEYVRPNGLFGAPEYKITESPARFRLAWVLYYPNDEQVWVDAGNGRILGGSKLDF